MTFLHRAIMYAKGNPLGQPEGLSVVMDKVIADTELSVCIAGAELSREERVAV